MNMKRLAKLRKELNLSQEELADRLGISLVTMNRYEVGKRVPDADVLTRMAKLFEVSADYLLELSNDKGRGELIQLSKQEFNRLKEIERKYNEIKSLVAD